MKNFKKIFFLSGVVVLLIILFAYNNIKNNSNEIVQDEVYVETNENNVQEKTKILLHITGEINSPGIIEIDEGSRLVDAIEAAGGLTAEADVNKINLAYVVEDGQKINIPNVNDKTQENYITSDIGENIIENININTKRLVNINTATQTELESLTGIGPSTALKIINYRTENGKFKTIEDIKNVPGIGDKKFEKIKNEICV